MDESYFKDRISGYFDKSLPPDEYQLVDDYLKTSAEGRALLERIGRLDEFVRMHGALSVDDAFFERQAQRIEARLGFESATPANVEKAPVRKWGGPAWRWVGVAASIAVLAFIGYHQRDIFGPADIVPPSDAAREIRSERSTDSVMSEGHDVLQKSEIRPSETEEAAADNEAVTGDAIQETGRVAAGSEADRIAKKEFEATRDETPSAPPTVMSPQAIEPSAKTEPLASEESVTRELSTQSEAPAPAVQRQSSGATRAQSAPVTMSEETTEAVEPMEFDDQAPADTGLLIRYRSEREQLMAEMKKDSSRLPGLDRDISPATKSLTNRQSAPATITPTADDRPTRLLEACYQIARLTPDEAERTAMIGQIEAMASDSTSTVRSKARRYFDELTRK